MVRLVLCLQDLFFGMICVEEGGALEHVMYFFSGLAYRHRNFPIYYIMYPKSILKVENVFIDYKYVVYWARCLKITEKVSFNIASEASYVYILSGQKLIKNTKNGPFWRVFENLKLAVIQCYQTGQF